MERARKVRSHRNVLLRQEGSGSETLPVADAGKLEVKRRSRMAHRDREEGGLQAAASLRTLLQVVSNVPSDGPIGPAYSPPPSLGWNDSEALSHKDPTP